MIILLPPRSHDCRTSLVTYGTCVERAWLIHGLLDNKGINYRDYCVLAEFHGTYRIEKARYKLTEAFQSIWKQLADGTRLVRLSAEQQNILRYVDDMVKRNCSIQKIQHGNLGHWHIHWFPKLLKTTYQDLPREDSPYWNVPNEYHAVILGNSSYEERIPYCLDTVKVYMDAERRQRKPDHYKKVGPQPS